MDCQFVGQGPFILPGRLRKSEAMALGLPNANAQYSRYAMMEDVRRCRVHGERRKVDCVFDWGRNMILRRG